MENLISPDLVRRLCWEWEGDSEDDQVLEAVDEYLRAGQARPWQRELVDPVLATAVTRTADAKNDDR